MQVIQSQLIGASKLKTLVLPLASVVGPGAIVYEDGVGLLYSDGTNYQPIGGTSAGPSNTPGFGASTVTPAALAATQNDYTPALYGILTSMLLLTPAGGGSVITGLAGASRVDGSSLIMGNQSAVDPLTLSNNSGSSLFANRFLAPGAADVVIPPQGTAILLRIAGQWRFA